MGFFRGLVAPFRGAAYVLRNGYTRYLVLPLIIDVILAAATMFAAYHYCKAELGEWLTHWPWLGGILLVVTTSLVGVVLFLIAQPLLLAAFADTLSERVERDVLGTAQTVPFVSSVGKSIVHGLIKVVFYGIALAISAVLFATTGGVGVIIGLALGGLSMAYDGFDYPLARRNASFGAKWAYLARNPGPDDRLRRRHLGLLSDSVRGVRRAALRRRGSDAGLHRHRAKKRPVAGGSGQVAENWRRENVNVAANT